MKKAVMTLLGAGLLASTLYAAGNTHMNNHMHEGKMMNHNNPQGMTDVQMQKMHQACIAKLNATSKKVDFNLSPAQQEHQKFLSQGINHEDSSLGG